jgi:UDP-GlcNAc:undecaprenyl-phosphate/decaprenyl-phosphate GlcNAc-1-phosphate transferase
MILEIGLIFFTALAVVWASIPSIIKVANQKHLYDEPNEDRKFHSTKIPTLGGIALFAGITIAFTLFYKPNSPFPIASLITAMVLLFFTGIKDDIIPLSPYKKFIAQLLATAIIIGKSDISLTGLYGVMGIYEFPENWEWFGKFATGFTIILIINAFNLIDGINGLAAGIGIIVCIAFGIAFYYQQQWNWVCLAAATVGALVGFLRYNLLNAKIFMGDTGALLVGLISAIFAIQFIENHKNIGILEGGKAPILAISILIIPLFDTLRVFMIRIFSRKSPFAGDRNHLHHALLDLGCSHLKASLLLFMFNIVVIITVWSLKDTLPYFMLFALAGFVGLMSLGLFLMKNKANISQKETNYINNNFKNV